MNVKKYLWAISALAMSGITMVSCDEVDGPGTASPDDVIKASRYAFIMYEGAWGSNNAGISYLPLVGNGEMVSNIFSVKNNAKMGDLANDMIEYDDHVYVLLNGSKYVARLNERAEEKARFTVSSNDGTPRYMDAEDGYLYVTHHGGMVSKLNAITLTKVAEFKGGDNLEGVIEEDGKLYVSNAFKVDGSGNYVYNQEVLVLDAVTMKQLATIAVVENPDRIYEINDRIYVISKGNYADVPSTLQVIDTKAMTATPITTAEKIAEGNGGLIYGVRSSYDANWNLQNEFFTYNPRTGVVSEQSFLVDAPSSFATDAIYLLEVDEDTGDIYVGTSDYVTTGTMYRFGSDGKLISTFDAGGINPKAMIFID